MWLRGTRVAHFTTPSLSSLSMGRKHKVNVLNAGAKEVVFSQKNTRRGVRYIARPSSPPPTTPIPSSPPRSPKKPRLNLEQDEYNNPGLEENFDTPGNNGSDHERANVVNNPVPKNVRIFPFLFFTVFSQT